MSNVYMNLNVVILAAGQGKRMLSNLPKGLLQVAGSSMIKHVFAAIKPLNASRIIVVHGYMGDALQQELSQEDITWVFQKDPLGTGHALSQALSAIDNNSKVLILCADVPLITTDTLQKLIAGSDDNAMGLITACVEDTNGLGRIIRDEHANVSGIIEDRDANLHEKNIKEINAGIYCIAAKFLQKWLPQLTTKNVQHEYYLTDIIRMASSSKVKINAIHPGDSHEIYGANTRRELSRLNKLYCDSRIEELLQQGVSFADVDRVSMFGKVVAGQDCVISANTHFEGNVVLGNKCVIESNVVLKNVRLGNGVTIKANSVINDSVIHDNVSIGPMAHLRGHVEVFANCEIGNFVEIKKSIIGAGSKIKHLSYIGDAILGKNVNIGAGVITCNYDGVNKHKTIIKDGAMVGSNTQLIAPITIGKNAVIGAGSTITKDAPDEKLTLSRIAQRTINLWKKPKSTKHKVVS